MLRRLPIFPLEIVLFPGMPLPLHIFEPRYRTMLADCLEGDERFGIVPLKPDGERPDPGSIGCIAHIRATQLLPDGRSNIVVMGENRFTLDSYLDEALPYTTAMVAEFEDEDDGIVSADLLNELRALAHEYLDILHRLNDSTAPDPEFPEDTRVLSFQVAAALELGPTFKRTLLALRGTGERIRLLLRLLPPLIKEMSGRAREHEHARTNGKSHRRIQTDDYP
jgi:Lon protease-like protein